MFWDPISLCDMISDHGLTQKQYNKSQKNSNIFFFKRKWSGCHAMLFHFFLMFCMYCVHKYPTIINTSLCFAKKLFKGNYCDNIKALTLHLWYFDLLTCTNWRIIWFDYWQNTKLNLICSKKHNFYSILVFRCLHEVWL